MRTRGSNILTACAVLALMASIGCGATEERTTTAFGMVTPSPLLSAGSEVSSTLVSPNYDGTGIWTQPNCSRDCFQLDLTQNGRGDLTLRPGFCAEVDCHVSIELRREGGRPKNGAVADYHASMIGLPGDARACIHMEGSAQIDSSAVPNVLTMTMSGVNWQGPEAGCQPESGTAVLQR